MRTNMSTSKVLIGPPARVAGLFLVVFFLAQVEILRPWYAHWDKLAHFLCFFSAWWVFRKALPADKGVSFALAVALGGLIELYQISNPRFEASWFDFLADVSGAGLAWTTSQVVAAMKERL
jgi:VanZ family protein